MHCFTCLYKDDEICHSTCCHSTSCDCETHEKEQEQENKKDKTPTCFYISLHDIYNWIQ